MSYFPTRSHRTVLHCPSLSAPIALLAMFARPCPPRPPLARPCPPLARIAPSAPITFPLVHGATRQNKLGPIAVTGELTAGSGTSTVSVSLWHGFPKLWLGAVTAMFSGCACIGILPVVCLSPGVVALVLCCWLPLLSRPCRLMGQGGSCCLGIVRRVCAPAPAVTSSP